MKLSSAEKLKKERSARRDNSIPADRQLCNKSIWARFTTMIAGITFNLVFAVILLFVVGLISGTPKDDTLIYRVDDNYPIYETNIKKGDNISLFFYLLSL